MTRLILFNKPYGVLSQFTDRGSPAARATLSDHLALPGFYPAGRLDRDSEGLLLLTDDGRLQARISDPRFKLPKTYLVQVEGIPDEAALERLRRGVVLKDGPTRPAQVARIEPPALWPRTPPIRVRQSVPDCWLRVTLREGRNRQVRRMTAAVAHPTLRLIRWSVGDWTLAGLAPGYWREATPPGGNDAGRRSGGRADVPRRGDHAASGPAACPVCGATSVAPLMETEGRSYWYCRACAARFLDPAQHPIAAEEHAHYLNHRNDPGDPRYRAFLSKLATPLMARLAPGSFGLDFGCGPGPALAAMLREAGHEVALYDPFFATDPAPLRHSYEFVTCTETAEHFHHPCREFARLRGLVRPAGWLGVMTCFQTDDARFARWHYRKDPTHVVFYREETFRHLAHRWGWDCVVPAKDVVLLRRPGGAEA